MHLPQTLSHEEREQFERFLSASEYGDDARAPHCHRVAEVAARIARALGMRQGEADTIGAASALHDIGKLAVPRAILRKPGALTEEERRQVKQHPDVGSQLLASCTLPLVGVARTIALSHHEWWDGRGYPAGAAGTAIPLPARIVAVADVFDALTHERPYKRAWTVSDAIAEVRRLSGVQFDPAVVLAFSRFDWRLNSLI